MPDFLLTDPGGKKFKVTTPDGVSQDDVTRELASTMTHQAEQPNPAKPYLDAASRFATGGISGVIGHRDPLGDLLQSDAANTAIGMVGPLKQGLIRQGLAFDQAGRTLHSKPIPIGTEPQILARAEQRLSEGPRVVADKAEREAILRKNWDEAGQTLDYDHPGVWDDFIGKWNKAHPERQLDPNSEHLVVRSGRDPSDTTPAGQLGRSLTTAEDKNGLVAGFNDFATTYDRWLDTQRAPYPGAKAANKYFTQDPETHKYTAFKSMREARKFDEDYYGGMIPPDRQAMRRQPVTEDVLPRSEGIASERIVTAAIKLKDGSVFTGITHADAIENAANKLGRPFEDVNEELIYPAGDFITSTGRLVDRKEAERIANTSGQTTKSGGQQGMLAEDFREPLVQSAPIDEGFLPRSLGIARDPSRPINPQTLQELQQVKMEMAARKLRLSHINEQTLAEMEAGQLLPEGAIRKSGGYRLPITNNEGREVGRLDIELRDPPGQKQAIQVRGAQVDANERGKGYGLDQYQKLADFALSQGKELWSDRTVEPEAVRIYESLRKRGYTVIEQDPNVIPYHAQFKITAGPREQPYGRPINEQTLREMRLNELKDSLVSQGWRLDHTSYSNDVPSSFYLSEPYNPGGSVSGKQIRISDHELGQKHGEPQGQQWTTNIVVNPELSLDDHLKAVTSRDYYNSFDGFVNGYSHKEYVSQQSTDPLGTGPMSPDPLLSKP